MNPKKSAILAIKNHKHYESKITNKEELLGIEIQEKYSYLGVIINNRGEINLKEQKVNNRIQYLQRKTYFLTT